MTFPKLTEYEEKVFARFWKSHTPGYHFTAIQLEGDKQLPVVAAGYRMVKKGVLTHWHSCRWGLSDLGKQMAEERQRKKA